MLTPDYLDNLPDALVELWHNVEDDILQDVARRIKAMGDLDPLTPTAAWQAWRLEQVQAVRQDVTAILAKYSGRSRDSIRQLLLDAGLETLAADDEVYRAAGLTTSPVQNSETLNSLLNAGYRQTLGTWQNLTATTAATVSGTFETRLDRAWLQVSSGAFDYNTAIRSAVYDLADYMPGVTYPSGHTDTLEVAVRRAVLTGVNQTAAKLQLARAEEMGCEFVEVTAHEGARPEHTLWQGKVYHIGGAILYQGVWYEDFETATGYGTGAGLCGWNCRHNFSPFWPGISVRNYTDARLEELSDPKAYEESQTRRALERKVRKYKRRFLAEQSAGLDSGSTAQKLRDAQQALADFVEQTGGKTDGARTSVPGFSGKQSREAQETQTFPAEPNYTDNPFTDFSDSGILTESNQRNGGNPEVNFVCKLNRELYKVVTEDIRTDEVIITDERIKHIQERHPNDYERFSRYLSEIIQNPDYIIRDERPNTATILKEFPANENSEHFRIALRLATSRDPEHYKNSIITFLKIRQKEWERMIRNKEILYKSE